MYPLCKVCDQKAVLKCGGCGKQLYCGDEHRKEHGKVHKAECLPYRVEKNSKYGRYLVTSRAVHQGETLLRERPLVVGPRVDSLPACLECLTLLGSPLPRCAECGVAPLCARCTHTPLECRFFAALAPELRTLCLHAPRQHVLPLKIMLHLLSPDGDPRYRAILEMEAHLDARRHSDVWISHQQNVVEVLQTLGVVEETEADEELVQTVCGVLDVNSFEVRGAMGLCGRGMRLRGIYPDAAMMAHNCITNTHLAVDDHFVMTIRAAVDIAEGQPILYNYTDPLQATFERQKHLTEGKYFSCRCLRCTDPTELGTFMGAIKCPSCKQGQVLYCGPEADWQCDHCKRSFGPGLMEITTSMAREGLRIMDRTDPLQLETELKRLGQSFPMTNSVMIDVKQSIVAAYREMEPTKHGLERKVELCRELIPVLRIIEPGISRLTGITLYEMHVSLAQLALSHAQPQLLPEAEATLKEAVGLLLHEPSDSPEGELARQAVAELRSLKQLVNKQQAKEKKKKNDTRKK